MKFNNKIYRFQEGGPMPEDPAMAPAEPGMAPEEAPMGPEQGGQDQMMQQIGQMAQEIIQQMGPDAAAMLAQAIMEMLQGGGAGAPAPEAPAFQRKGGRLVRVK